MTAHAVGKDKEEPVNEVPSVQKVQEMYQIRASEYMLDALRFASFAAELNCPCYDVKISTIDGGVTVDTNKERCPQRDADNDK